MVKKTFLGKYYSMVNNELIGQFGYDSDPSGIHRIISELYDDLLMTVQHEEDMKEQYEEKKDGK